MMTAPGCEAPAPHAARAIATRVQETAEDPIDAAEKPGNVDLAPQFSGRSAYRA